LPANRNAAPKAGSGRQNDAGAADRPGPGQGGGGEGTGTGSGRGGSGDGGGGTGGGGGGIAVEPKLLSGSIRPKDYPKTAARARAQGTVVAIYTVGTDGRVSGCSIIKSSRNSELDSTTCRLITERFRYAPARNRSGDAVAAKTMWQQKWWLEGRRGEVINPDVEIQDKPDVTIRQIPQPQ
jgi:protein TonB